MPAHDMREDLKLLYLASCTYSFHIIYDLNCSTFYACMHVATTMACTQSNVSIDVMTHEVLFSCNL